MSAPFSTTIRALTLYLVSRFRASSQETSGAAVMAGADMRSRARLLERRVVRRTSSSRCSVWARVHSLMLAAAA